MVALLTPDFGFGQLFGLLVLFDDFNLLLLGIFNGSFQSLLQREVVPTLST